MIKNNDKNLPIAFFDSGVGGLTVFEKLKNYSQMKITYTMVTQKICHMEKKQKHN